MSNYNRLKVVTCSACYVDVVVGYNVFIPNRTCAWCGSPMAEEVIMLVPYEAIYKRLDDAAPSAATNTPGGGE